MSCSDDDSADANKPRTLYVESIVIASADGGGGGGIELTYNKDKLIETISSGGTTFELDYKSGKLFSLTSEGANPTDIKFGYDSNGILDTYTVNDEDYEVTYDEDNKKYTIEGLERSFTLDDNNDIITIGQGGNEYEFEFDTEGKGSLFSGQEDSYLIAFALNVPYILSKRPATLYATYAIENTLNADGYIYKAVLTMENANEPSATIYYNYIAL